MMPNLPEIYHSDVAPSGVRRNIKYERSKERFLHFFSPDLIIKKTQNVRSVHFHVWRVKRPTQPFFRRKRKFKFPDGKRWKWVHVACTDAPNRFQLSKIERR
jgi:hypothetical protein